MRGDVKSPKTSFLPVFLIVKVCPLLCASGQNPDAHSKRGQNRGWTKQALTKHYVRQGYVRPLRGEIRIYACISLVPAGLMRTYVRIYAHLYASENRGVAV